jgi:hypothetical protein
MEGFGGDEEESDSDEEAEAPEESPEEEGKSASIEDLGV